MDIERRENHFDTYGEYREAVAEVVRAARSQLMVFDADLVQTGLESRSGAEMIERFLLDSRTNQLRIVLHHPETIAGGMPTIDTSAQALWAQCCISREPGRPAPARGPVHRRGQPPRCRALPRRSCARQNCARQRGRRCGVAASIRCIVGSCHGNHGTLKPRAMTAPPRRLWLFHHSFPAFDRKRVDGMCIGVVPFSLGWS
jgi:hypothetical protein